MVKYEKPCLEIEHLEVILTLVEISGGGNETEIQTVQDVDTTLE